MLQDPKTWSIIRTQYVAVQEAISSSGPVDNSSYSLQKIAILGAGMMGSGIAFEAARAGIDVILKDVTLQQAEQGKAYAEKVSAKWVTLGKMDEEKDRYSSPVSILQIRLTILVKWISLSKLYLKIKNSKQQSAMKLFLFLVRTVSLLPIPHPFQSVNWLW